MNVMTLIKSYCQIIPGWAGLNGETFFKTKRNPMVIKDFFHALYEHLGIDYRKFYKMDALSKLGFLASEMLLAGSDRELPKPDMGIILFNKSSSLAADMNYQQTIRDKENFYPSPAEFVHTLPNIVAGEIAIRNKIYGETVFYTQPHFCTDTICETVDDAMCFAGIKYALTGWIEVDAFKNKFECLMMLCVSKQGKTAIDNSESFLSPKPDDVYHHKFHDLNEYHISRLYHTADDY